MLFRSPRKISLNRKYNSDLSSIELVFEGSVINPDQICKDKYEFLLGGLGYSDGHINYKEEIYSVAAEDENLVVRNQSASFNEIGHIKDYIANQIKDHEACNSDIGVLAKRLIVLTGSDEMLLSVVESMIENYKSEYPNIPKEYWVEFKKLVRDDMGGWLEAAAKIYTEYYTINEIQMLIDFYESDIGKKVVSLTPAITGETMRISQEWVVRHTQYIMEKAV